MEYKLYGVHMLPDNLIISLTWYKKNTITCSRMKIGTYHDEIERVSYADIGHTEGNIRYTNLEHVGNHIFYLTGPGKEHMYVKYYDKEFFRVTPEGEGLVPRSRFTDNDYMESII